ncbi:hypothetical protein BU25DRAFT_469324 [Macroventuria anomochaeta]|uniref:Uncharacterized protein n=1 Tax=Macroventuria anomochaeta TaxID=301207 RepID=A0ACB6RZ67_9PLEO|nr:uncharacterized protein BU25DRAFT_469324 [Macroventuria anomochaeta]KAF2627013.1 hypothetical protein BU25DRAFT_469324 [Macroventuria anomochaeta]
MVELIPLILTSVPVRYRVRRRRKSLVLPNSGASSAPKLRVRARSQQHPIHHAELSIQLNSATDLPSSISIGKEVLSNPNPATNIEETQASLKSHNRSASSMTHSPKSGEKTVAQLRQRFERPSNHGGSQIGAEPTRRHRRSRSIMSTFVPIVPPASEQLKDVETSPPVEDYVLPAFTFNPASELSLQTPPSASADEFLRSTDAEVLQPTVCTGEYTIRSSSKPEDSYDVRSTLGKEGTAENRVEVENDQNSSYQKLAGHEHGVSIIDFAYVYVATKPPPPISSRKHVRFASKSEYAPSAQYKSSSDDSTQSSTQDLVDLGDCEPQPIPHSFKFRVEKHDDSSSEEEKQLLLLLPASVYVPPAMLHDGAARESESVPVTAGPHVMWDVHVQAGKYGSHQSLTGPGPLPFSVSICTLLGLQPGGAEQASDDTPAIEFQLQNEQSSSEEHLPLLPASVYIPTGSADGHVVQQIDDMPTIEGAQANTDSLHADKCDETSHMPAQVVAPVTQAIDTPGKTTSFTSEHQVELGNRMPAEQVLLAAPDEPDQTEHQSRSKPFRKRRNFMGRLLGPAGRTESCNNSEEGDIGVGRQKSLGRRLGKGALLLVMWKCW